jgi:membrane-associated phospholipid phosphatase
MKNRILYVVLIFFINFQFMLFAQEADSLDVKSNQDLKIIPVQEYQFSNGTLRTYPKPKWMDMINKLPKDFMATCKDYVAKDHAWYLGGAVASTVLLLPVDQKITDNTRAWADKQGLSPDNVYGKFGPLENIPKNLGAGFYLIGNGTTVILLSAGLATFGLLKNDYRAQATASGLMESLALSGVFVQAIKRITGRESPYIARANGNPGGDWNPFPSFKAYATNTPSYDAVPSGHLTTIMAGLTVITSSYPDYKWIKPVGYSLITAMCIQMIQSEVHWVSDYPLAVLIGYIVGKNIAQNRFKETSKLGKVKQKVKFDLSASKQYGFNQLGLSLKF